MQAAHVPHDSTAAMNHRSSRTALGRPPPERSVERRRVLIIDDDIGTQETFALALRLEQFDVTTTSSGREGIDIVRDQGSDFVVIDLRLEDMSGIDVIQSLREFWRGHFIVVSGFVSVGVTVEAMKLGADNVLEKPVNIDTLVEVVRAGLTRAGDRRLHDSAEARDRLVHRPRTIAERWAGHVIAVCDSQSEDGYGDLKTLEEWAQRIAVSYSSLCETCRLLGIRPLNARDFARVLRALRAASVHGCSPEVMLNVSDRRTIRHLSEFAGVDLEITGSHATLQDFLTRQHFVAADSEGLRIIVACISDWLC